MSFPYFSFHCLPLSCVYYKNYEATGRHSCTYGAHDLFQIVSYIIYLWKVASFLFMSAKIQKIWLTLLDEIFIVVIGVGTLMEKIIYCEHSVLSL